MFDVHDHDYDPSCVEHDVDGFKVGQCVWFAECAGCRWPKGSKLHIDHCRRIPMAEVPVRDNVNSPSHYTWLGGIEVIDITEHLPFTLGNVVKYVLRADHKGKPIEDLEKAAWYLSRELERRKRNVT